jgi:hypothetical protein
MTEHCDSEAGLNPARSFCWCRPAAKVAKAIEAQKAETAGETARIVQGISQRSLHAAC